MKLVQNYLRIKNRMYAKYILPKKEKTYEAEGEQIHYVLLRPKKKDSKVLVVGFQAYNGAEPRYNYVGSLNGISAYRLYVQDDFVPGGNYYLGRNGNFNIERGVFSLIDEIVKEKGIKKLIFIGSSKGGYAAVNFGLNYPGADMVIAAPQYHLGTYMYETKKFNPGLKDILREGSGDAAIAELDERLAWKIREDVHAGSQRLFIHYSTNDATYDKHIKDMINDAANAGIGIEVDVKDYEGHNALRYFFPEYLKKTVVRIISEDLNGK